jgi:site-specific recombinase XerD
MTDARSSTALSSNNDHSAWVASYSQACLSQKNAGTIDIYQRSLRDFLLWLAEYTESSSSPFHSLTRTTVEMYLSALEKAGYSVSHRVRVKSILSSFCQWLIDEQGLLKRNPTRNLEIPTQHVLAPRILSEKQRLILRLLVEQAEDLRGEALFALGYWAGCRVSDIAHLLVEHTHVGPKIGWIHVGYKGGKFREIDLLNQARRPLFEYFGHGGRDPESPYLFTSQRNQQLTEAGIHHWFRTLKRQATSDQWEKIADLTFHNLRHDFAHRAREAGWTLEEVAYYLGHVTKKGTPAIQTTARYTQVSRELVKEKLKYIKG